MLILFDPQTQAYSFPNYHCLFNHLEHLERRRQSNKGLIGTTPHWIFAYHSAHRVNNWYAYAAENPRTSEEERELGLLEIIQGNLKEPLFVPVTPATNLDDLRVNWCRLYCKNRGYTLIETVKPKRM